MLKSPIPVGETVRLCSLQNLKVLDTLPEERFDRITRLVARVFDVPIALVSLVDVDRQWFKSRHGIDAEETPREISFCGHAILEEETFVVHDAAEDERFADNPLVTDEPKIRFYAGHPVHSPQGTRIGTLCIIDRQPRAFSNEDAANLQAFAEMVDHELSLLAQTTSDELTSIANRRGFAQIANHMLALCHGHAKPATVIGIDLNKFKLINDTYGHEAGDKVLERFAALLVKTFRNSDVVARFGGDEFCVLSSYTVASEVRAWLDRLGTAFASSALKREFPMLSWSAGVAEYDPSKPPDLEALLSLADANMYEVKQALAADGASHARSVG